MKISIPKGKLAKCLSLVEPFAEQKSALPILGHILLKAQKEELTFSASNLDLSVHLVIAHDEIAHGGILTVPAKKFSEIVRLLPEGTVTLKSMEHHHVQLSSSASSSTAKFLAADPENFPVFPEPPEESIPLPIPMLLDAIRMIGFALSENQETFALSCMRLETSGEHFVRAVGTDGHRISLYEANAPAPNGTPRDVLIPRQALVALAKVLSSIKPEVKTIDLSWTDHHIFFCLPGLTIIVRKPSGQFPEYGHIIQNLNEHKIAIPASELKAAIRRVAVMSDARAQAIRLALAPSQMVVSAESSDIGTAREVVSLNSYAGPELTIGFNARHLLEFLDAQPAKTVEMYVNDAESPVHWQPVLNGSRSVRMAYTVMPLHG